MANNREFYEIDLTGYKERRGARVPEGTYNVRVDDVELTTSNNGNAMLNMWLAIVAPGTPEHGETILDRLVATPNAAFRTVHFMTAVGMQPPIGKKLRLPTRAIMGKTLVVEVTDDEYQGTIRSAVNEYLPSADTVEEAGEVEWPAADDHTDPQDGQPGPVGMVPDDADDSEDDVAERAEELRRRVDESDGSTSVDVEAVAL